MPSVDEWLASSQVAKRGPQDISEHDTSVSVALPVSICAALVLAATAGLVFNVRRQKPENPQKAHELSTASAVCQEEAYKAELEMRQAVHLCSYPEIHSVELCEIWA